MAFQNFTSV